MTTRSSATPSCSPSGGACAGLRSPLDHVFHSDDFRLVSLRRLPYVGSDHFPVYAELSYEPQATPQQEAPEGDAEDMEEASETVARGKTP